MTNIQLTDRRTIGARIAVLLAADSVPLSDAWKALIDYAELERGELQELRSSYLALRSEIEDIQSQLYEAENQANEYASDLQERRKAGEWIPISAPPDDCRVVYCWSEKIRLGIEARYRNGEWAACHDDEEDEEEYITHWMELPKGPRQ